MCNTCHDLVMMCINLNNILNIKGPDYCCTLWDKVSADNKMNLIGSLCTIKSFWITSHGDEVIDFYDKEIPKVDYNHISLAVITLDFALNKDGNYYPQALLKECKYNEKKVIGTLMIILVIFLLLMILMKNSFSLNERVKNFCFVNVSLFLTILIF